MSEENQNDPTEPLVDSAPAAEFKPLVHPLWDDVEGIIALVPADGELHAVVAVNLSCAAEIIQLAYPNAKVGMLGYAKARPFRGDPVWFQVPVVVPNPDTSCVKDLAEAKRRAVVNYERRGF